MADFTPEQPERAKVKRGKDDWHLVLKPTRDIAGAMGAGKRAGQFFVGFALESDEGLDQARAKMKRKRMDLMVLNSLQDEGAGFGVDTNRLTFIGAGGETERTELASKQDLARDLVARILNRISHAYQQRTDRRSGRTDGGQDRLPDKTAAPAGRNPAGR